MCILGSPSSDDGFVATGITFSEYFLATKYSLVQVSKNKVLRTPSSDEMFVAIGILEKIIILVSPSNDNKFVATAITK